MEENAAEEREEGKWEWEWYKTLMTNQSVLEFYSCPCQARVLPNVGLYCPRYADLGNFNSLSLSCVFIKWI